MSNMCSPEDQLLDRGLRMIEQGIELVRRYGRQERGAEALTGALRGVFQQGYRLEAARTALIGELDQIEQARPDGERERSVPGWLRSEMHLTDSAAYGQVRLARQLAAGLPRWPPPSSGAGSASTPPPPSPGPWNRWSAGGATRAPSATPECLCRERPDPGI